MDVDCVRGYQSVGLAPWRQSNDGCELRERQSGRTLCFGFHLPVRQRGRDLLPVAAHDSQGDNLSIGGKRQHLPSGLRLETGNRVRFQVSRRRSQHEEGRRHPRVELEVLPPVRSLAVGFRQGRLLRRHRRGCWDGRQGSLPLAPTPTPLTNATRLRRQRAILASRASLQHPRERVLCE